MNTVLIVEQNVQQVLHVVDRAGKPIQLRGMSWFWSQWSSFYVAPNVDAVADKVTPSNIVHRQTDKARDRVRVRARRDRPRASARRFHTPARLPSRGTGARRGRGECRAGRRIVS